MERFFISAVLGAPGTPEVSSCLFAGAAQSLSELLTVFAISLEAQAHELLYLERAARLDDFRRGDFAADIDLAGLKAMDMTAGTLVSSAPLHGELPAPLPQSGCVIGQIRLSVQTQDAQTKGAQDALVAVSAQHPLEGLRILLSDVATARADLSAIETLMDAAFYEDDSTDFTPKPSKLIAQIAGGASIAFSTPVTADQPSKW